MSASETIGHRERQRIWDSWRVIPRDVWLLLASSFLVTLPLGLMTVLYPLYLHALGISPLSIGGIFTTAGVGSSLALLATGPLADRWGRRSFLLVGTVLPAVAFLLFSLTTAWPVLVVASVLGGVGFSGGIGGALVTATFNPTLSTIVTPQYRTTVMVLSEIAWTGAMGLGALMAGVPVTSSGRGVAQATDHVLFLLSLGICIVAVLLVVPVAETHHPHQQPAHAGTDPGSLETDSALVLGGPLAAPNHVAEIRPLIVKLAIFFTLQGAGLGLMVQLLPLWFALRFHATSAEIAPWFAASQLIGPLVLPLAPMLARRAGIGATILLMSIMSTALMTSMPLMVTLIPAGCLFVARSAFIAVQWPAQHSFLQGAIPPRVRATATSLTLGSWSMANALMPLASGYFLGQGQLTLPILLGCLCYGLAAAWFWFTLRHTPMPED